MLVVSPRGKIELSVVVKKWKYFVLGCIYVGPKIYRLPPPAVFEV
jgi:hypothetical protein